MLRLILFVVFVGVLVVETARYGAAYLWSEIVECA